jgi:hypothetical protein
MSCPFAEPPPRRRLSIAHLMLWTLGCAVALGFYREFSLAQQRPENPSSMAFQVFGLLYCIPAGARIGSVLLFGWMCCRGDKSFPTQPGHWLLLNEGISHLLSWLGRCAVILVAGVESRSLALVWASLIPSCVFTSVAYGVALSKSSNESRLWKAAFLILLLEHAVAALTVSALSISSLAEPSRITWSSAWSLFNFQYNCFPLILLLLSPIVALADSRRRQTDFLHWTGVIAIVATALLNSAFRWVIVHWR